jgi:hypothetical protein
MRKVVKVTGIVVAVLAIFGAGMVAGYNMFYAEHNFQNTYMGHP